MKHLLQSLTVLLLFLAVSVQAQNQTATLDKKSSAKAVAATPKGPVLTIENEKVDYGTIAKGADRERELRFKNTGDQPLIIQNVKGSCGCTVPTWPKEPIMPGQSSSIKINYDTERVGQINRTITITTNAAENNTVNVSVVGNVLPEAAQEGNVPLKKSSSLLEQPK